MASYDDTNVLKNKLDWAKAFNRSFSLPLDRSSMFASKADADKYALGDGSDSRALGKTSYIGQTLTVYENDTVAVYVIDQDRTLTKLASGGSTDEILKKLNAEISARISVDEELSNAISTITDVTLPLSVGNLQSSLSATVEKLETPESGYEATYVVKQGGVKVGASINIPKDKVISSAYMVTVKGDYEEGHAKPEYDYLSSFTVSYAEESTLVKKEDSAMSATYWSIYNAYTGVEGGDGSYLRITVTNDEATPIYIAVPELVDTYVGGETTEISVHVVGKKGETRTIYADLQAGSIAESKLCADFAAKVNNVIAAQAADRTAIEILSGDDSTEGSVKKALKDAKAYTDEVSAALSTDYTGKINALDLEKVEVGASKTLAFIEQKDGQVSAEAVEIAINEQQVTGLTGDLAGISANLTGDADGSVNSRIATAKSEAILSAKNYVNEVSAALSTDYFTQIQAEQTRATAAEAALDDRVDELSGATETISADHEGRIAANERAIELLSSAVHFRGALLPSEIASGETLSAALVRKYKPCAKGDLALYTGDGTEYIYNSDLSAEESGWVKIGDEGTYVTWAAYNTKMAELDASDATLSGMIQSEETRAKGIESTISTDLDTLEAAYATKTAQLDATDAEISGKVDNKVKVGTGTYDGTTEAYDLSNKTSLSVVKIADEDYYRLVSAGKQNDDVIYIVSSDYVNGHDQRIINVGNAVSATDAVNLSGMNAAIEAAKSEIVANALSGVRLNDVDFTVTNNVAVLSIDIISCGGAE